MLCQHCHNHNLIPPKDNFGCLACLCGLRAFNEQNAANYYVYLLTDYTIVVRNNETTVHPRRDYFKNYSRTFLKLKSANFHLTDEKIQRYLLLK